MIVFLWCVYLLAVAIRLLWWLLFRAKASSDQYNLLQEDALYPSVSIIICAHNNCEGLKKLLPALLTQHYPLFEIIIVNDRSTDDTTTWLLEQGKQLTNLTVITLTSTPDQWNNKKYALSQGIKKAQYPLLALTDSDCLPLSNQWLKHLSQSLSKPGASIFLGYSPNQEEPGVLNKLIQTETLFTALQYFSLTNVGMAYMGVGRNLGYSKHFITPHMDDFPFKNHLGGDDDLLINQLSTGKDAVTCSHPDSFVMTFAPKDILSWWKQKRRHLSAGAHYKPYTRGLLSTYWLSSFFFWLLFFILLGLQSERGNALLIGIHFLFFGVGTVLLYPLFRIFKAGRLLPLFLFWDFLYIACSSIIGFSTFLVKNKKWS